LYEQTHNDHEHKVSVLAWTSNNRWAIMKKINLEKKDHMNYSHSCDFLLHTEMSWSCRTNGVSNIKTTLKDINQENMVMEILTAIPGTLAKVNANVEAADGTKLEKHDILEVKKLILTEDNQNLKVEFENIVDNKPVHLSLEMLDQNIIILSNNPEENKELYETLKYKALKFKTFTSDAELKSETVESDALKSQNSKSDLEKQIQEFKIQQKKTTGNLQQTKEELQQNKHELQQNKHEIQQNKHELQQNKDEFQQNKEELQKNKEELQKTTSRYTTVIYISFIITLILLVIIIYICCQQNEHTMKDNTAVYDLDDDIECNLTSQELIDVDTEESQQQYKNTESHSISTDLFDNTAEEDFIKQSKKYKKRKKKKKGSELFWKGMNFLGVRS
jgi:hypothetical protein